MRAIYPAAVVVALCGGCRDIGYQVAPVEGKVTLNGEPLADAHVSFRPVLERYMIEAGPGSVAYTNQQGEFTLRLVDPDQMGAVVGRHRVAITLARRGATQFDQRRGPGRCRPTHVEGLQNAQSLPGWQRTGV